MASASEVIEEDLLCLSPSRLALAFGILLVILLDPVVNLEIVTKKRFLVYLLSLGHSYQDYTGCLEMQSGQKFLSAIFKMATMNYRKCYKISFRANIYEHMVSIYIYIVTKHALSQKRNF